MKTIEETRRELFEHKYPLLAGMYWCEGAKQYAGNPLFWLYSDRWEAFNAALDCVVIELPKPISEHNTYVNGFVNPAAEEYDCCLEDCRAAIESKNLGLRVK